MATTRSATAAAALSMKLVIDRKAQRVLFAEASNGVVDFVFSLLTLPVATAVKLVGKDAMVGCVGNVYASVEKLDATYVQPGAAKDALLSPTVLSPAASANSSLLRLPWPSSAKHKKNKKKSAAKNNKKNAAVAAAASGGGDGKGFVQGIVTYTVMEDLKVAPMSAISSITMLNTFAVRDLADLQEKTVQLGYNEGLAILMASLQSKTVLTDVFLGNKNSTGGGRA